MLVEGPLDALAAHIAEVYEERAAIMEYDGELSRGEAKAEAIRLAWKPHLTHLAEARDPVL